mmetsp:Transcript_7324/g.16644  ORF Transcript_7324/g.16644 Transcript_7324/m.16644 type:complete len:100 (+) Transcript_7324:1400-1699(+)
MSLALTRKYSRTETRDPKKIRFSSIGHWPSNNAKTIISSLSIHSKERRLAAGHRHGPPQTENNLQDPLLLQYKDANPPSSQSRLCTMDSQILDARWNSS